MQSGVNLKCIQGHLVSGRIQNHAWTKDKSLIRMLQDVLVSNEERFQIPMQLYFTVQIYNNHISRKFLLDEIIVVEILLDLNFCAFAKVYSNLLGGLKFCGFNFYGFLTQQKFDPSKYFLLYDICFNSKSEV